MSQASNYSIANATGAAVRSDLNDVFAAIVSQNSGATEPSVTYAYMWWADTATTKLKMRNGANSAWIEVGTLDQVGLNIVAHKFPNVTTNVTATSVNLNTLTGVNSTLTASELNILDGVTSTATELNILDGVTSTTAELNILDGVTSTASELSLLQGITSIKDEDTMSSDSATSLATQQSIKAYVDTGIPRVSDRVCIWEGTNGTPANGLSGFAQPSSDRQKYTLIPSTHFGVSSGTFISMYLEFECVNPEDGFVVGDVIARQVASTHAGENEQWPIWHNKSGDLSDSLMRIHFRVGDYGANNEIFHLYTRPAGDISNNTWYNKQNFALYARIYYTL